MMKNLLYKEVRLAAHPTLFVFTALGALVIVPAYPYGVVFLFGCLAPFITFMFGRETKDTYYTALLPIQKRDVVKGKLLLVVLAQITQLLVSLPFAFLRVRLLPDGNPVGIEANVAYYGFGLIIYGVFNAVFFPQFYKTAQKVGRAFILAILPATAGILAMETLSHVPALAWMDSVHPAALLRQLPILLAGAAIHALGAAYALRAAGKRFEQVDL